MFDPKDELDRAIERIRDDALMLSTEHAQKALAFIELELAVVRRVLSN